MAAKKAMAKSTVLEVSAPNFKWAEFKIEGKTPYCQNSFGGKVGIMRKDQEQGSTTRGKKKREPKDFNALCEDAKHYADEGWVGIPCSAFRNAMISACRTTGVVMARAKLAVYTEPDGYDKISADPLVKITKGKPKHKDSPVRNASGVVDIRPRPVWDPGWQAKVRIRYDADMLRAEDVANLLMRAGLQVGIGEGRPDSKNSAGVGWGLFEILSK